MGELKFGGVSTRSLDLVIQTPPVYTFPEKDVELQHIPGRNGDILIDNDCYKNVNRVYSIASAFGVALSPDADFRNVDFIEASQRLIQWLYEHPGYQRLEDSYDPDVYRIATFKSGGSLVNYYDNGTAINITFECKPQRFLKSGEVEVHLTGTTVQITNPTYMKSNPLLKLYDFTVDLNSVLMMSITNASGEITSITTIESLNFDNITIDSDKQLIYSDDSGEIVNTASSINLNGLNFPKLHGGVNTIGIHKYEKEICNIKKYSDTIDDVKSSILALSKPYESLIEEKQDKVEIIPYEQLVEKYSENYAMGAYANLCLEESFHVELDSANNVFDANAIEINYNSINIAIPYFKPKTSAVSSVGTYHWEVLPSKVTMPINDMADSIKYFLMTGVTKTEKDPNDEAKEVTTIINKKMFLLQNDDIKYETTGGQYRYGAFVYVEDTTDNNLSSKYIKYVEAIGCPTENLDEQDGDTASAYTKSARGFYKNTVFETYVNGSRVVVNINKCDILQIFPELANSVGENHECIIKIYKAKWDNTLQAPVVDIDPTSWYTTEDASAVIDPQIIYDDSSVISAYSADKIGRQILAVNYYAKLEGYYHKSEKSGIFSSLFGKLFNSTGWSKIITANLSTPLESVEWSSRKRTFVYGSTLSEKSDYVIERNYIALNNLPQYPDIVLEDTYVTDENGNIVKDSAGNDINQEIKCRFVITGVNDNLSQITSMTAKVNGFYKWVGKGITNDQWKQCTAGSTITIPSPLKTTSAYEFIFIEGHPTYFAETDFPKWLDPDPILYNNSVIANTELNKLNATHYNFKIAKDGFYRYVYFDNNIAKNTEWVKKLTNGYLFPISPESTNKPVAEMTTACMMELDIKKPDVFPITPFFYVQKHNDTNYIINNDDYIPVYDSSKVYSIDDTCEHDSNIYKCNEDNTTGTWDSSKWMELGIAVHASEYDPESIYQENAYCFYRRAVYQCNTNNTTGDWDETKWDLIGNYVKDVGFYYLDEHGEQIEYPANIPLDWITITIENNNRENPTDWTDTTLKFYVVENDGYYKWDTNLDWIRQSKMTEQDYPDGLIITASYKTDSYLYFMNTLPDPELTDTNGTKLPSDSPFYDLYDLIPNENTNTGNPESITIKVLEIGYYKFGKKANYVSKIQNEVLSKITIFESIELTHLKLLSDSSLANVKLDITPRWWKL